MAFAQLASKLGPMLKSVAGNQKLRNLGAKASKGALGKDGHEFFKTLRAGEFGQLSKKDLAREFGSIALDSASQRAASGGKASGLNPAEAPIRSMLSGMLDSESARGRAGQKFLGSGAAAQMGQQLSQKAISAGMSGAGSIAKFGGKAGLKVGGYLGRKVINAPFAVQAAGARAGALGFKAAAVGGKMLGKAGDLTGSLAGSSVGKEVAESAGEIAKNFSAIAKNPINPANWAKLASTVATLPNKFIKLGESLVQANEKLAPFSAQMALASAEYKMGEVQRNIESAQATGASSRQMTESLNELKDAVQPIKDTVTNIAQVFLANILDVLTKIVNLISEMLLVVKGMGLGVTRLVDWFIGEERREWLINAITFGMLKADEKKNATQPLATSLQIMRDEFSGASTMNKSNIGSWQMQNSQPSADGTMGGSFNSPVDANSGLSGANTMGGKP